LLFNRRRRALHDFIAGNHRYQSRLIKNQPCEKLAAGFVCTNGSDFDIRKHHEVATVPELQSVNTCRPSLSRRSPSCSTHSHRLALPAPRLGICSPFMDMHRVWENLPPPEHRLVCCNHNSVFVGAWIIVGPSRI
jgi:hypothetical protein